MRCRLSSVALVVACLGGPPCFALTVTPAGDFSAQGRLAMGRGAVSLRCEAIFAGSVSATGAIVIRTVGFAGGNPLCRRIVARGLPWSGQADSPWQLTLRGLQVEVRIPLRGGVCGPVDAVAHWLPERSAVHFRDVALVPDCRLDGVMTITPFVHVNP